jgi:hydroxymethylbilane synthase
MKFPFRISLGTRGSDLALKQTELVTAAINYCHPEVAVRYEVIQTTGDRRQDMSLVDAVKLEDKGIFIQELESALINEQVDAAVHSLKDVPSDLASAYIIAAYMPRASIEDVLITRHNATLATLPAGAKIGTSSIRRACQLRHLRPDLEVVEIRGNVGTRIRKCMGDGAAV